MPAISDDDARWPALPLAEWEPTRATLHMWTQVIGKIRLGLCPPQNHWWHVPLYITPLGLTTGLMPYGDRALEIAFDFVAHKLHFMLDDGTVHSMPLRPISVADFYTEVMQQLEAMGVTVDIWTTPVEIPDPIPFEKDTIHSSYDPKYVARFGRLLVTLDDVFKEFRGRFLGKSSPVHFFWGSFDLAATRFSGRLAPPREGADKITLEAYSHEVISAGWWAGSGPVNDAAFYCYAAPALAGLENRSAKPNASFYSTELGEYVLMYDAVRRSSSPREALLEFLESTYASAAELADWNRSELDWKGL